MEYFEISKQEFTVAIPDNINKYLLSHLVRKDEEEDLCFALYNPSTGIKRTTALIQHVIFPKEGDRQRHGNVSFNPQYLKRVCKIAQEQKCGIAFIHSHPSRGWQGMSKDDIVAEEKIAPTVLTVTDFPVVGLTVGQDDYWSGRIWQYTNNHYEKKWASVVKVIGKQLTPFFTDFIEPKPLFKEEFKRTITVWGETNHSNLARLKIGIVGLGSVGSIVAETLARMGMQKFVLIDFDEVQRHNLDRLLGATKYDIGHLKVDITQRQIRQAATAKNLDVSCIPYSIAEEEGFRAAIDCDVIFSCVDRPRARNILNHIAYNHLVPVIDGGIKVRFANGVFDGVDWQLQTIAPGKPCLKCLKVYEPSEVQLEIDGKLDDPSYLDQLPSDHSLKANENIFPFSANLASLKVFQFIALVTNMGDVDDFGVQRFRYKQGVISSYNKKCNDGCDFSLSIADGDKHFSLFGNDISANKARERQKI